MKNRVNDLDNDKMGLLHIFALNGQDHDAYDIIKELKDAGVDIDAKSPMTQETPLQCATVHTREKVVKALLDHGARTHISDWKGDSSISTAEKKCAHNGNRNEKCCRVLKLLLAAKQEYGNSVDVQGQT